MTEEAEAIKEVAKTAGKAIEASKKMGAFLNLVFGDLIEDGVGLLSDRLRYYRAEKLVLLHEKTKKKLEDAGVDSTNHVLPKIAIPLIESAAIEDNDNIHTKWANMLANAMNPEYKKEIKRSYISILSDLESIDVLILDTIIKQYRRLNDNDKTTVLFDKSIIAKNLKVDLVKCEISLRNLIRLGCIKPGVTTSKNITFGNHGVSSYKDTELVGITALGEEFYKAVS